MKPVSTTPSLEFPGLVPCKYRPSGLGRRSGSFSPLQVRNLFPDIRVKCLGLLYRGRDKELGIREGVRFRRNKGSLDSLRGLLFSLSPEDYLLSWALALPTMVEWVLRPDSGEVSQVRRTSGAGCILVRLEGEVSSESRLPWM